MVSRARRRVEKLERDLEALAPEPDPEAMRAETEAFLDEWASHIVKVAHAARKRRERGEARDRPISEDSGVNVCGEAVSYDADAPPDDVRTALHRLLHDRDWPGVEDPETIERLNGATREALRRAFVRFAEETSDGPGQERPCGGPRYPTPPF